MEQLEIPTSYKSPTSFDETYYAVCTQHLTLLLFPCLIPIFIFLSLSPFLKLFAFSSAIGPVTKITDRGIVIYK